MSNEFGASSVVGEQVTVPLTIAGSITTQCKPTSSGTTSWRSKIRFLVTT